MRKYKPFPNRFIKIEIKDKAAGDDKGFSFYSSGNMHPYISPNISAYLPEELQSKVKPRVDFDIVYDVSQCYATAQIRIFNLKRTDNDFLQLSKEARVKIEAGYNGQALNLIFDGFIAGEPFATSDFPHNYTLIQLSSAKNSYKIERQFNVHLQKDGVKNLIKQIEDGFNIKIKLPQNGTNIATLLARELDISVKVNLAQGLEIIKGILGVDIVNTNENLFECFDDNGKKLLEGNPTGIKIGERNIIKFEFLFKEKENLKKALIQENGGMILSLSNKDFFNKAENQPIILMQENKNFFASDIPKIPARTQRQIDAKISLFLQGGLSLGQLLLIKIKETEHLFFNKSINFNGSSHGTGADFKTDLELYNVKDA